MYLRSFDHFRALAICLIVAGHSFNLAGIKADGIVEQTLVNPITGGTTLFVFISVFLFQHIFVSNFTYLAFLRNQIQFVLLPYLCLGFLPIIVNVLMFKQSWGGYFVPTDPSFYASYLVPFGKYLISGRFFPAYWYIPFILVMFALSPLHYQYAKLSAIWQRGILISTTVIALLIHRPEYNIGVFHSVIYYTPIYLFGITYSLHYKQLNLLLKGQEHWLALAVISIAVLQTLTGDTGNYQKAMFTYAGIDLMFVQKLALCLFLTVFLSRFEQKQIAISTTLANTSFAIFFFHPYLLWIGTEVSRGYLKIDNWLVYLVIVVSILYFCVKIANRIKQKLAKNSRYIIGY